MTLEELYQLIKSTTWSYLGRGSYNIAYVSYQELTIDGYTGRWVMKTPNTNATYLNHTERAVSKWRLLNPEYPAIVVDSSWLSPYLGRVAATEQQITQKLLDIYLHTRHIIEDACGYGNFLIHEGRVVCVDIDLAVRRGSFASDEYLTSRHSYYQLNEYLFKYIKRNSSSAITTLVLNYLEQQLPAAQIKDEYISEDMLQILYCFCKKQQTITVATMEFLLVIIALQANTHNLISMALLAAMQATSMTITEFNAASVIKLMHTQLCNLSDKSLINAKEFEHSVAWLLDQDPSLLNIISQYGYNLLHVAIYYDNFPVVQKLLSSVDLNINLPINCVQNTHYNGMTALDFAFCLNSSDQIVQELLCYYTPTLQSVTASSMIGTADAPITRAFLESSQCLSKSWPGLVTNDIFTNPDLLYQAVAYLRRQLFLYAIGSVTYHANDIEEIIALFHQHPAVMIWRLNVEGDTFLHCAIDDNRLNWIHVLVILPQWDDIFQIKNKHDLTGLHKIIFNKTNLPIQHNLPTYLYADNIEKIPHLLHYAAEHGNAQWCEILLFQGISPKTYDQKHLSPEQCWSGAEADNPIRLLRFHLYNYAIGATCTRDTVDTSKLLALITQHTHFMTWNLDSQGNNFIHLAFLEKNHTVIREIIKLPNWLEFYKSCDQERNALFSLAAKYNYIEYYPYLTYGVTQTDRTIALFLAAREGHKDYCELLLTGGDVDLDYIDSTGKSIIQAWAGDAALNPFITRVSGSTHKQPHTAIEIFPAMHDRTETFHNVVAYADRDDVLKDVKSFLYYIPELLTSVNSEGKTALMLAACVNSIQLVMYFIQQGADVNYQLQTPSQDSQYERFTALDFALHARNDNIVKYLSLYGAVHSSSSARFFVDRETHHLHVTSATGTSVKSYKS